MERKFLKKLDSMIEVNGCKAELIKTANDHIDGIENDFIGIYHDFYKEITFYNNDRMLEFKLANIDQNKICIDTTFALPNNILCHFQGKIIRKLAYNYGFTSTYTIMYDVFVDEKLEPRVIINYENHCLYHNIDFGKVDVLVCSDEIIDRCSNARVIITTSIIESDAQVIIGSNFKECTEIYKKYFHKTGKRTKSARNVC